VNREIAVSRTLAAFVALLAAAQSLAHHSVWAEFDRDVR
jgi:hypothetical protein